VLQPHHAFLPFGLCKWLSNPEIPQAKGHQGPPVQFGKAQGPPTTEHFGRKSLAISLGADGFCKNGIHVG